MLFAVTLCPLPSTLQAQTRALIVTGLGGEPKFTEQFAKAGETLSRALHVKHGLPDSAIVWLGEDSVSKRERYAGRATKEAIERAFGRIADRSRAGDQVLVVLIGHGSGEGTDSKLSIPGPDLTAADFARLLSRLDKQRVAFVNLASASGDMIEVLSGPNRVVLTATKTAFERNESQFGQFFVDAMAADGADTDKDGRVSLLEAYRYANVETKRHYENASKLQSEHAQLDDDGDGKGVADPTGRTGDGVVARRFFLDADKFAARVAAGDPQLAKLYQDRFALEEQIDALKKRKSDLEMEAYDAELEKLLLSLARTSRQIRQMEGRGK
jgi:hypothetical protein